MAAVRSFPVAVSAEPIRETASQPEADSVRQELRTWAGDRAVVLRVDRLEPSKNILRGFLAFGLFLRRYPEWRGRVQFLCLFSPSREEVPEYQSYGEECLAEAERVNEEFGTKAWNPIEVKVQEDYAYAVAAYDLYDVLFVNPTYDGMNLVAMEGPLVNRHDGVVLLSRNAGAYTRLGRHALGVNPFDLAETAEALHEALSMAPDDRARRARGLARTVQAHTPASWLASQLEAVDQVRPPVAPALSAVRARARPGRQSRRRRPDQSGGPVHDDVGRRRERRRRLGAVHGDLHRHEPLGGEPVEHLERPEVGEVVARVEHGVERRVDHDRARRRPPFSGRPAGTSSSTFLPSISSMPASAAIGASAAARAASAARGSLAPR